MCSQHLSHVAVASCISLRLSSTCKTCQHAVSSPQGLITVCIEHPTGGCFANPDSCASLNILKLYSLLQNVMYEIKNMVHDQSLVIPIHCSLKATYCIRRGQEFYVICRASVVSSLQTRKSQVPCFQVIVATSGRLAKTAHSLVISDSHMNNHIHIFFKALRLLPIIPSQREDPCGLQPDIFIGDRTSDVIVLT